MKQKGWILGLFVTIIMIFLALPARAVEIEDVQSFTGFDALWENLPDEVDGQTLTTLLEDPAPSTGFSGIMKELRSAFSIGLTSARRALLTLGVFLCLAALFTSFKTAFSERLSGALDFLLLLCLAVWSYAFLREGVQTAVTFLQTSSAFMVAALPVQSLLMELGGNIHSAGIQSANINFVIALFGVLQTHVISPLLTVSFSLSLSGALSPTGLGGVVAFFRKTAKLLIVFLFTVLSGMLAAQNLLGRATDSVQMRAVRFAAGNFIPIVGNLVGTGAGALSSSWNAVKSQCGVLCLVIVLFLLLRPLCFIFLQKMVLRLGADTAKMLGLDKESGFLEQISSFLELLLALCTAGGCYFLFYLALFLKTEGNLV